MPGWWEALGGFWRKINNDWIFNLAGLLAYNFLLTLFPILLLLLAVAGIVLGHISAQALREFVVSLAALLPGKTGPVIVGGVVTNLQQSVSLLLVIGLGGAFLAGSRLFITLEHCFGIVFRLRGRSPLRQNLMAIGMLLLYLILVPVVFLGSLIPPLLSGLLPDNGHGVVAGVVLAVGHPLLSLGITTLVVAMAYACVPNQPIEWRTWRRNWKGAVVAAVLLMLYAIFFPWYQANFVRVENYGSVGAFAIVILLFFYYLAFILLLGAEINSWAVGQRAMAADLPGILHTMEEHRNLRQAARPTAGKSQEEMQHEGRNRRLRKG
jgi:membrane protein